jgi:MraZ protein
VTRSVFTGEYRHTVDDKGRIAVPSRFRAQLDGGAVVSRWIDGCLAIHTRTGWSALAEKIAALPVTDASARLFGRSIFAGATEADLDRQGRVLLPAYLREGVGLATDAVVVGARDHAEIWAPATWAEYRRAMDDPQTFAQAIQGLGI